MRYSDVPRYDPDTSRLSPRLHMVRGKECLEVDLSYEDVLRELDRFDVLVIPGGRSPDRARRYPEAVEIARRFAEAGKPIVAICHGPQLLISAGVVRGRRVTGNPGIKDDLINAGAQYTGSDAERDGSIVTIRHPTVLGKGFRLFVEHLRERGLAQC